MKTDLHGHGSGTFLLPSHIETGRLTQLLCLGKQYRKCLVLVGTDLSVLELSQSLLVCCSNDL